MGNSSLTLVSWNSPYFPLKHHTYQGKLQKGDITWDPCATHTGEPLGTFTHLPSGTHRRAGVPIVAGGLVGLKDFRCSGEGSKHVIRIRN